MPNSNSVFVVQAATHLKGLAEKAKLNEKHVRIARIYKAKMTTLTSERDELQGRVQHMSEEIEKLKSDLKHTSSARARAESREGEARSSLTTAEGELREVRGELQALQNDLVELVRGCSLPRVSFNWLGRNSSLLGVNNGIFKWSCARSLAVWTKWRNNLKLPVVRFWRARYCWRLLDMNPLKL